MSEFITELNLHGTTCARSVISVQRNSLLIFERRTLKHLATLPTSKTLVHLEYNRTRDEIISGGSEGCYVWRLVSLRVAAGCDGCYAPGI